MIQIDFLTQITMLSSRSGHVSLIREPEWKPPSAGVTEIGLTRRGKDADHRGAGLCAPRDKGSGRPHHARQPARPISVCSAAAGAGSCQPISWRKIRSGHEGRAGEPTWKQTHQASRADLYQPREKWHIGRDWGWLSAEQGNRLGGGPPANWICPGLINRGCPLPETQMPGGFFFVSVGASRGNRLPLLKPRRPSQIPSTGVGVGVGGGGVTLRRRRGLGSDSHRSVFNLGDPWQEVHSKTREPGQPAGEGPGPGPGLPLRPGLCTSLGWGSPPAMSSWCCLGSSSFLLLKRRSHKHCL